MLNFLIDLPNYNILEISGDDAGTFLQSQFTSDVSLLSIKKSQFSSWCNPQGKVIANFIIFHKEHNSYLLILPENLSSTVHKRLSMYILRAQVNITDLSNLYRCYGLYGVNINESSIKPPDDTSSESPFIVIDLPVDAGERFIIAEKIADDSQPLEEIHSSINKIHHKNIWQTLDILAGLPWITNDTSEMVLPQEISLDHLDALSYNKGCYPGQEIIARVHFRGNVKNKLYTRITDTSAGTLRPGIAIYTEELSIKSGLIINTVMLSDERQLVLIIQDTERSKTDHYLLKDGKRIQLNIVRPSSLKKTVLDEIDQV